LIQNVSEIPAALLQLLHRIPLPQDVFSQTI
jgi:hypothetical protein